MARHNSTAGKSVKGHPLFPAVVSLWFCALFGLGTLAVRAALLDVLVMRLEIGLILPAAMPPLSLAGRLLLATAMALLGALLGLRIGRALAHPATAHPATARHAPIRSPRAPIVAEATDAAPVPRRRNLVPQPGDAAAQPDWPASAQDASPQILDIAAMDLGEPMSPPLELGSYFDAPAPVAENEEGGGDEEVLREPEALEPTPTPPVAPRQVFGMANEEIVPPASGQQLGQAAIDEPVPSDFIAPVALRRLTFGTRHKQPEIVEAPTPSPEHQALPTALRPPGWDAGDNEADGADAFLQSLLPPRRTEAAPAAQTDSMPLVSTPRIEDPQFDGEAVEPVVIFPGQATRTEAAPEDEADSAALGEDVPDGAPVQSDPAETARALRSALVNLQRLSATG